MKEVCAKLKDENENKLMQNLRSTNVRNQRTKMERD